MARCHTEVLWWQSGGIISLAKYVTEHRKAVEHDLLTQTGYTFDDIGRTLSWGAFESFLSHVRPDSAIISEENPDVGIWASALKTNAILADIFDVLSLINTNLMAIGSGKRGKMPKPYPRLTDRTPDNERHIGSDPLPVDELQKWFDEKRARYHARNSTSDNTRDPGVTRGTGEDNK